MRVAICYRAGQTDGAAVTCGRNVAWRLIWCEANSCMDYPAKRTRCRCLGRAGDACAEGSQGRDRGTQPKKKPAEAGQENLADQRLTDVSSALLGLLGDVPGVPVVDGVVASMLLPVVPVAGVLEPDVALAPEVALSLLPLVVSVVLQAARATQNAAAKIVFTIAMMFSFYKRVETM